MSGQTLMCGAVALLMMACSDPGTGIKTDELGGLEEPAPPTYAALLYGTIRSADGTPAPNVVVWLVGAEQSENCRVAPDPWLEAHTDDQGRYRLWAYTSRGPEGVCVQLLAQAGMNSPPFIASEAPVRPNFRISPPYDSVRLNGVVPAQ